MNESMRVLVSGRFTVNPPSLRPDTTSKPEVCEPVGEDVGDEDGEILIAVLIFMVRVRRMGIFAD
jgi:hypothetical protein